jgi:pentatricopeptide repeat protein
MSRALKVNKPVVALRLWNLMVEGPKRSFGDPRRRPVDAVAPITSVDIRAANILMNCYAKLANVRAAEKLLQDMKARSSYPVQLPAPNLVTYNTFLSACHKAGDLDAAVEAFREMVERDQIQPDQRTYTSLIATVARRPSQTAGKNDPTPAFTFLQDMVDSGVRPNGMTFSALIDACGRCQRVDLALQGLRIMLRQKAQERKLYYEKQPTRDDDYLLPNEVGAWTAAVDACGKTGRWETALKLFHAMPRHGVQPNQITTGCLTDALLRAGRTAETLEVLRYMKEHGIPVTEVMYTSLMSRAEKLVELEQRQELRGQRTTHHHFEIERPSQQEEEIMDEDTKAMEVYTELIRSLLDDNGKSARKYDKGGGRVPLDSKTTVLLKVFLVFQQMRSVGAEPDLACYNALLRACAKAGDLSRAETVLRQIQAADLDPNDSSWRLLMRAASHDAAKVESIWQTALSYHQRSGRRRIDEPSASQQWKPSVESVQVLLTSYLQEAARTREPVKAVSNYEQVVQLYDDILMGDRRMGMDRVDVNAVLDSPRTMVLVLQALVALEAMVPGEAPSREEMRSQATSILKLPCFNSCNEEEARMGWSAQQALRTARSWSGTDYS